MDHGGGRGVDVGAQRGRGDVEPEQDAQDGLPGAQLRVADEEDDRAAPAAGRGTRTRSRRGLLPDRGAGHRASRASRRAGRGSRRREGGRSAWARRPVLRRRPQRAGVALAAQAVASGGGTAVAAQPVGAQRVGGRAVVVVGAGAVVVVRCHGGDVPPPGRDGITMRSNPAQTSPVRCVGSQDVPGTETGRFVGVSAADGERETAHGAAATRRDPG